MLNFGPNGKERCYFSIGLISDPTSKGIWGAIEKIVKAHKNNESIDLHGLTVHGLEMLKLDVEENFKIARRNYESVYQDNVRAHEGHIKKLEGNLEELRRDFGFTPTYDPRGIVQATNKALTEANQKLSSLRENYNRDAESEKSHLQLRLAQIGTAISYVKLHGSPKVQPTPPAVSQPVALTLAQQQASREAKEAAAKEKVKLADQQKQPPQAASELSVDAQKMMAELTAQAKAKREREKQLQIEQARQKGVAQVDAFVESVRQAHRLKKAQQEKELQEAQRLAQAQASLAALQPDVAAHDAELAALFSQVVAITPAQKAHAAAAQAQQKAPVQAATPATGFRRPAMPTPMRAVVS